MKIIFSLFLTFLIYGGLLFSLYIGLFQKKNITKTKIVYVHTAIIAKQHQKKKEKKELFKPKKDNIVDKKIQKEIKTKDNFSKGGDDIKFDDIFSNVSENITTSKIKEKKHLNMTKKVGHSNIEEVQKQISRLNFTTKMSNVEGSKVDLEYIQNEFSRVWGLVNTNPGDFVTVQVNIYNGIVNVVILNTNLDTIILNQFLNNLKSINTKNINMLRAVIDFKSKLKEE